MANANKNIVKETVNNATLFNAVMENVKTVGSKEYAYIPLELLYVDSRYQRDASKDAKVDHLERIFDINRMDALRVSAHSTENRFAIIDGGHRFEVIKRKGFAGVVCEILTNLGKTEEEILFHEAEIYSQQGNGRSILTPSQKHNANVIQGVAEYVLLDRLCKEYGIIIKTNACRGVQPVGSLASYTDAIHIAKVNGESGLRWVFDTIKELHWNECSSGYSCYVLSALEKMYEGHSNSQALIISTLRKMKPTLFKAKAMAAYPSMDTRRACTLYLEDLFR